MLGKFAINQKQLPEQLQAALKAEDRKLAERLVHTLKGLAGNIGAEQLQQAAATLEAAIRAQQSTDELQPLITSLTTDLNRLIAEIENLVVKPAELNPPVTTPELDRETLSDILNQLLVLFDESSSDSLELLESNQALLKAVFAEEYLAFYTATQNFEFDEASSVLKQIAANLNLCLA
jgi:two-component system sensor histidine kinase/response regulator